MFQETSIYHVILVIGSAHALGRYFTAGSLAMLQRFYQWQIGVCTARWRSKLKILVCSKNRVKSDPEIHFHTFIWKTAHRGIPDCWTHHFSQHCWQCCGNEASQCKPGTPRAEGKAQRGSPQRHGTIRSIFPNKINPSGISSPIKFRGHCVLELPEPVHPTGLRWNRLKIFKTCGDGALGSHSVRLTRSTVDSSCEISEHWYVETLSRNLSH